MARLRAAVEAAEKPDPRRPPERLITWYVDDWVEPDEPVESPLNRQTHADRVESLVLISWVRFRKARILWLRQQRARGHDIRRFPPIGGPRWRERWPTSVGLSRRSAHNNPEGGV